MIPPTTGAGSGRTPAPAPGGEKIILLLRLLFASFYSSFLYFSRLNSAAPVAPKPAAAKGPWKPPGAEEAQKTGTRGGWIHVQVCFTWIFFFFPLVVLIGFLFFYCTVQGQEMGSSIMFPSRE